jgi:hypothetical protein
MIGDKMYFSDLASTLQHISADEKAVFVSGLPGSGKTFAALEFCTKHKENLYFSFKNLDTAFALRVFCNAHTEIFGDSESWFAFFECLKAYGNKKHPLFFFDNAGERNDKDNFYEALNSFLESDSKTTVVLLGRPWEAPPIPCREVGINFFSMPKLADVCSLPDETAAKLYCLTGAIPALLSLYDDEQSFEDNVRAFLSTDSTFYRLAVSWMTECFRTPESYNTLLYAMANGYNRIGEIAKFSGFPKNKCDKYIKALLEHGLVIKTPGENGHTKYLPANNYLTLWYKCLLTAVSNPNGSFGNDVFNRFMQVFNDELMADFYKDMCYYWLEENINSISTEYIDTKNSSYLNVKVGNVTFDFACEKKQAVYAYYDTTPGGKLTQKLWKEIENSTTKKRPFYENEYVICTANRVPDSFWTLSKRYDNVHIVSQKMLFATCKKEYNKIAHPRFVPSFV